MGATSQEIKSLIGVVKYEIHVMPTPVGNDTTANGSLTLPYATIQAAYNYAKTIASLTFTYVVDVIIHNGVYVENVTFDTNGIRVRTASTPALMWIQNYLLSSQNIINDHGKRPVYINGTVTIDTGSTINAYIGFNCDTLNLKCSVAKNYFQSILATTITADAGNLFVSDTFFDCYAKTTFLAQTTNFFGYMKYVGANGANSFCTGATSVFQGVAEDVKLGISASGSFVKDGTFSGRVSRLTVDTGSQVTDLFCSTNGGTGVTMSGIIEDCTFANGNRIICANTAAFVTRTTLSGTVRRCTGVKGGAGSYSIVSSTAIIEDCVFSGTATKGTYTTGFDNATLSAGAIFIRCKFGQTGGISYSYGGGVGGTIANGVIFEQVQHIPSTATGEGFAYQSTLGMQGSLRRSNLTSSGAGAANSVVIVGAGGIVEYCDLRATGGGGVFSVDGIAAATPCEIIHCHIPNGINVINAVNGIGTAVNSF